MRPAAPPHARLRRALDRGRLDLAEAAARECRRLDLEDALEICLLMQRECDERFERAAVRWLGRLLAERPTIGFELARQALDGMADLMGTAPDVGRSELAVVLRGAGLSRVARVLEQAKRGVIE